MIPPSGKRTFYGGIKHRTDFRPFRFSFPLSPFSFATVRVIPPDETAVLYFIDGYNLLFSGARRHPRDARELERDREELIALLTRFHADHSGRSILAFDCRKPYALFGLPRRQNRGSIEVRFAPEGLTADDMLKSLIAETRDAQGTAVVTSDREILDAAEARGVRSEGAREFWERLAGGKSEGGSGARPEPPGKQKGLSDAEVDRWMKEFGVSGEELL